MAFKDFSIFSTGGHLVYWSGTILAILVWSYLGNISVKFESHRLRVQEGLTFKANYSRFSIFSCGGHFVNRSGTVFATLVEDELSNIPLKFEWIRPRGIGGVGV